MFFSPMTSFAFTFLAIFLFTTVVVLEYFSILPHYPVIAGRNYRIYVYQDLLYVTTVWASFTLTLIILTYLASGRSERLLHREADVLALSETLKHNSAKLQALNESAWAVNSTLGLTPVLNQLLTNTAHVMRVRACSIRLPDRTGKLLEPAAVYGLSQEYLGTDPIELERAIGQVDLLRKLIDDLLDLANGRASQTSGDHKAPVPLEGIVENVVKRFEMPALQNGLTLEWHGDTQGGESPVWATAEGLARIFNNLVSNAVKYTPQGGKVRVALNRTAKEVAVEVADTGFGIPIEAMPHLQ